MNLRSRSLGLLLASVSAVVAVASCGQAEGDPPTSPDAAVGSSPGPTATSTSTGPSPDGSVPGPDGSVPPDAAGQVSQLASPAVGEKPWARESEHAVLWNDPPGQSPVSTDVSVSYSLDEGATWKVVPETDDTREGRFLVDKRARRARITVPATGGTTIRVRVTVGRENLDSHSIPLIPSQKRNYSFTRVSGPLATKARDGACGLVHDGAMWVLGGWNPDDRVAYPAVTTNDVWRSTDAVTWTRVKTNTFLDPDTFNTASTWSGRHAMGCVAHAGKMFLVGGDGVHAPTRDVWSSVDGAAWTRVSANTNYPARVLQPTFSFQDKLWVMGGQTWYQEFTLAYPDVWSSPNGVTWTRVPTEGPQWAPRGMIFGPGIFKGRMWLVAGGLYDEPGRPVRVHYDDVWSSADGAKWQRELKHTPFIPRDMLNVNVFDDRLWALGGYSEPEVFKETSNLKDVYYTADGSNWYELVTPSTFTGRHASSTWSYQGALYFGLGNAENPAVATDAGPGVNRWLADIWKIAVLP